MRKVPRCTAFPCPGVELRWLLDQNGQVMPRHVQDTCKAVYPHADVGKLPTESTELVFPLWIIRFRSRLGAGLLSLGDSNPAATSLWGHHVLAETSWRRHLWLRCVPRHFGWQRFMSWALQRIHNDLSNTESTYNAPVNRTLPWTMKDQSWLMTNLDQSDCCPELSVYQSTFWTGGSCL